MADAKPQELDPALIMRVAQGLVRGLQAEEGWGAWRYTAELAIRSLGIPAAALNALVRGEAVVVPRTRTREMCDARQDVHGFSPLTDQTWAKLCAIRACGETGANGDAEWSAMLAASPYAAKE